MFYTLILLLIKISVVNNVATIEGEGIINNDLITQYANEKYTKIIINPGPTSAAKYAFRNCVAVETITIPNSLISIPGNSFFRCNSLKYFIVNQDHSTLSTDEQFALYDKQKTKLIHASDINGFIIPSTVTCIDENAFNGNYKTSSINIPKSVSQILTGAFNEVMGMPLITFESNSALTEITTQSFWYSTFYEVHIPASVTKIHTSAFYSSNIQILIFDDISQSKLEYIGESAFAKFLGTEIKLPDSVTTISKNSFLDSQSLETINIPKSCSYIHIESFSSCTSLSYISIAEGNQYFEYNDGILVDKAYTTIYSTSLGASEVKIKRGIQNIAAGALQSRKTIKKIEVIDNDSFSTDGQILYNKAQTDVFSVAGGATSVTVAATVATIKDYAFSLSDVTTVTFLSDNTLTIIGMNAFLNCKKLTTINIPKSIQDIGNSAFEGCISLSEYVLNENAPIDRIKQWSLQSSGITRAVLSKNIATLGYFCFGDCLNLETVVIPTGNKLTTFENGVFSYCINLVSIQDISNVELLMEFSFRECAKLSFDFRTLTSLKNIDMRVFGDCGFTELYLPKNILTISNQAFISNTQLTTVTFDPESQITTISASMFANCSSLSSISLPKSITKIDPSVFSSCFSLVDITITGTNFKVIEKLLYTYDGNTLVLCPPGLEKANVTTDVKILGNDGFNGCKLLKTITFKQPSEVSFINANTFAGCTSLTSISLPDSITEISDYSFGGCTSLSEVILSSKSSLNKVGNLAFSDCTSLKDISLPSNLASLGDGVFKGCTSLKHVPLSGSLLTEIPSSCFQDSGIETFTIPGSIKSIASNAFRGCPLTFVSIHDGVTSLGSSSFAECDSLRRFYFCGISCEGDDTVLPHGATVFVRKEYESGLFCGHEVVKALDGMCNLIPPTPTASWLFTQLQLEPASNLLIASACLISDIGADVE